MTEIKSHKTGLTKINTFWDIPLDKRIKIVELSTSGMKATQIAVIYGINRKAVPQIIKNITKEKPNRNYYSLNATYFDIIDTQEKAYFLGLLYADGNITLDPYYTMKLSLQSKDEELLIKLQSTLETNQTIKRSVRTTKKGKLGFYSTLPISNKHLTIQLANKGCVPKKSLILTYPKELKPELQRHFIRGYFDGDGCITSNAVTIVSTNNFCCSLKAIVKKELGINCTNLFSKIANNGVTTVLQISGRIQLLKFLDWLYNDSSIKLTRKYNRYLAHVNYRKYCNTNLDRRNGRREIKKQLLHATTHY